MIIVIDGKIGSGKTTLSEKLANKYNYVHINCDQEIKKIYQEEDIINQVLTLLKIKEINYTEIAKIIFNNQEKKQKLEIILYKRLKEVIEDYKKENKKIIIEGYNALKIFDYDLGIYLVCNYENRLLRVEKRDKRTILEINQINNNQSDIIKLDKNIYFFDENNLDKIEKIMEQYDKDR